MHHYKVSQVIGDGSFGVVLKANNKRTGDLVAIKKIKQKFDNWEDCMRLKEVKALCHLRHHPNIVKLKEVIRERNELNLVFEHLDANLYQLMKDRATTFSEHTIRQLMYQMLLALVHVHRHGYFHRDLKPENLLVSNETVKIADFGLAREIRSRPPYTEYVSTRWYRAPEVILRSANYNSPIDVWAAGAIMGELYTLRPMFPGESDADELHKICAVLGTPSPSEWNDGYTLCAKVGQRLPQYAAIPLKTIIPGASDDATSLLYGMLKFDPVKRMTAACALQHPYFTSQIAIGRVLPMQQPPTGIGRQYCTSADTHEKSPVNHNGPKVSSQEVETVSPRTRKRQTSKSCDERQPKGACDSGSLEDRKPTHVSLSTTSRQPQPPHPVPVVQPCNYHVSTNEPKTKLGSTQQQRRHQEGTDSSTCHQDPLVNPSSSTKFPDDKRRRKRTEDPPIKPIREPNTTDTSQAINTPQSQSLLRKRSNSNTLFNALDQVQLAQPPSLPIYASSALPSCIIQKAWPAAPRIPPQSTKNIKEAFKCTRDTGSASKTGDILDRLSDVPEAPSTMQQRNVTKSTKECLAQDRTGSANQRNSFFR
eukprot:GHVQ01017085.1.p1 GENE.GHVQ01017085.1~~GHVQ01017085.1.p1  ORF type:complete len:592 (+),score=58.07 GHVQ01017085.1:235-2010(+)